MTRTKRGIATKKRRKKIISITKGFQGSHSKLYRIANQQAMRCLRYSYSDRRKKKNETKKIWIQRINAIGKLYDTSYNKIMNQLKNSKITLNKKTLAKISERDKSTFKKLIDMN